MPISPRESPGEKKARLRAEAAARSKQRRSQKEEENDPWTQNISNKKHGRKKYQDDHPE